jgi:hypothetical protein
VGLTAFVGAVFGLLTFPLIAVLFLTDDKPPGHRVRRVIGFAVVAAAVSIMFLPVSAHVNSYEEFAQQIQQISYHADCGSAWHAMFSGDYNTSEDHVCGRAAFPHLWIAGGVAAVGMGIAFWGASRGRLLAAVCLPLVATGLVHALGLVASSQMYGKGAE